MQNISVYLDLSLFSHFLGKDKASSSPRSRKRSESGDLGSSPPDHEFVSDSFSGAQIDQEALQRDMQLLGMNSDGKAIGPQDEITNKQEGKSHHC